jgi:hypothetical protein
MLQTLNIVAYALFLLGMGYYFITNLQWYSYKLERVLFHHTKTWWHFVYFLIPYALYEVISNTSPYDFVVVLLYAALLFSWYRGLDKPLVWTGRVKRFYALMVFFALFITFAFGHFAVVIPIFLAYFLSLFIEKMLFHGFKVKAEKKIEENVEKLSKVVNSEKFAEEIIEKVRIELSRIEEEIFSLKEDVQANRRKIVSLSERFEKITPIFEKRSIEKKESGKSPRLL